MTRDREKASEGMYTKYYGLTKKPFENTPDPDFLYLSRNHREILASLVYGVNSARGLILAMGDVGTGKTTLINALQKELDPSFVIVRITNPRLFFGRSIFTNILEYFAREFGISYETANNLELIESVTSELEMLDKNGRRAVLVIDEAHLLSEESLHDIRLLSNIENEKTKLIQILLIGQNELNSKLQEDSLKALKQRFNITRRLMPLDKSETTNYIMHRLHVTGGASQIFQKRALSLIFKKSSGVPRLINQICDSSLLIGYAVGARSIGIGVVKEVINDMNAVYKPQETHSTFFFHEWRWPAIVTTAALLIILVAAILVFNRSFFSRDWGSKSEPVSEENETLMEKRNVNPQAKYLISGDIKPINRGGSGLDNEKGPLQGNTESTSRDLISASDREPFFEAIESRGTEDEKFEFRRYLSEVYDGDVRENRRLQGSTVGGIERDSTSKPVSGDKTAMGRDTDVLKGYYEVRKGDTLSEIAGRKDVYDDPLKWPSLFRLNLDKLSRMNVTGDFEHKALPEGLHLKFVTPAVAKKNLARLEGKPWVVNVLSAKDSDAIVPPAVKLIKNGYHVYITKTNIKGDEWIRLRVGFFETRSKAESIGNQVVSLMNNNGVWVTKIGRELEKSGGY